MTQITIEQGWPPLFFSGSSASGKFYAAALLKVVDNTGVTWYMSAFNWGPGHHAGWAGGQIGLGNAVRLSGSALTDAQNKLAAKRAKGYRDEAGGWSTQVPHKLRRKVEDLVATWAPAQTPVSVPPSDPAAPKISEANGADYEAAVARIITTEDMDAAMAQYQALLANFTDYAEDFHRAEAAMEMAQGCLRVRLDA